MKALILNSGLGTRMGGLTTEYPKCMTEISAHETIISRQLRLLCEVGISDIIITTGPFAEELQEYCTQLALPVSLTFVNNPKYAETNYIYSIYTARKYLGDEIILLHGDLVFEASVLDELLATSGSGVAVSVQSALGEKDFKAVVENGIVKKIGTSFYECSVSSQPLYKLRWEDWKNWMEEITHFCERGDTNHYAENAFNEVSERCQLHAVDMGNRLCKEIDNKDDLHDVTERLQQVQNKTAYMSFSSDIIHGGHIRIIRKAKRLGRLIVGVLTDEAVASFKRYPLVPYEERKSLIENIDGVFKAIPQESLSYRDNIEAYKPDYVVHGDNWKTGFQKPIREEVIHLLDAYGGKLVEYPYSNDRRYDEIENRTRQELSLPDLRRGRLRKLLNMKKPIRVMEAHDGLSGLLVEETKVYQNGAARQFDAMWVSSLCDSTAKGKPDIELVDMSSRFRTIDDIMEVSTKPIIFDGDTGGLKEHFSYTVRTLERMGVSMIIIEDKTGLKKNSLFGTEVEQTQDSIENFCEKLVAGKNALKTSDFMICTRIESLILEKGIEDALTRAHAYVEAGADAVMIHSRQKDPGEIFKFVERFRDKDANTPLVVVPTSFASVTEEELAKRGVDIVIYANHLMRASVPAMRKTAEMILENHRAQEADALCMPFGEIIRLIPEEY